MDPDVALEMIRQLANDLDVALTAGDPPAIIAAETAELVEHVQNLDEWLSTGGFLPFAWQGGRPFDLTNNKG
jgi:hypothetical protein